MRLARSTLTVNGGGLAAGETAKLPLAGSVFQPTMQGGSRLLVFQIHISYRSRLLVFQIHNVISYRSRLSVIQKI